MESNPIDVQRHLKGVDYPATKEGLASAAQESGAPQDLVKKLRGLNEDQSDGPDAVMSALKNK